MVNCGEKLIDPELEVNVEDGEHNTICEIRDYLVYNNPKMTPEIAESLALFYCNYIHGQTTIWVILRHVSQAGATRVLSFQVVKDEQIICIDWFIQDLLGNKAHKKFNGLIVKGGGMDMGFHIVYCLSRKLFGDGYRFKHRWL